VPDPPKTLAQAEERFKSFLLANGYPPVICWITSTDLVVISSHEYSIRKTANRVATHFSDKFVQGLAKGNGVELRALCASGDRTFATVFVPTDGTDADSRMMGDGVKLSCPMERRNAKVIGNPLRWLFLSRRDGGRSNALFE
jgi:hypothetical protein